MAGYAMPWILIIVLIALRLRGLRKRTPCPPPVLIDELDARRLRELA